MRRVFATLLFVALITLEVAACGPTALRTPTPLATQSALASSVPSVPETGSPAPGRTPVPGFEDWQLINGQSVQISLDGEDLVMHLIGPALWFNADRGALFFDEVTGDFRATATVRTSKASDPSKPPGKDGTIQLAGLMARSEVPVENYVFIVTGSIGASTGIESKTTTASRSIYTQRAVPGDGAADLRLCRQGHTFSVAWRPAGSTEAWQPVSTFVRPELPPTLQIGANIYTDSVPDLVARYENLMIEALAPGAPC